MQYERGAFYKAGITTNPLRAAPFYGLPFSGETLCRHWPCSSTTWYSQRKKTYLHHLINLNSNYVCLITAFGVCLITAFGAADIGSLPNERRIMMSELSESSIVACVKLIVSATSVSCSIGSWRVPRIRNYERPTLIAWTAEANSKMSQLVSSLFFTTQDLLPC